MPAIENPVAIAKRMRDWLANLGNRDIAKAMAANKYSKRIVI